MNAWAVPGYTESRELGSGGSGRVVLAVHDATGVPVAVKYLSGRLRSDAAFVREFRAEARLLGALHSPYVVGLYEYVEAPDGAAIVMELVDGVALRALLRQEGATGPEAALVVLKGSLLGLAAAHRSGVVHRDYKPENVLVAADGSSKLVDFGIAAGRGTTPGVAGTPAYMAPEQWSGEPASPSADVYAATATFFECLTGRKPYTGENVAELALQHIDAPVPHEQAPEPVRPLIRRGLAKSPGERPANAAVFVAELEEIARSAYGPDWEERGQRKLAALAALLPLLFPSAASRAAGTTDTATTALGGGWSDIWSPGLRGALTAVAALVVAALVALGTGVGQGGSTRTSAQSVATTTADPHARLPRMPGGPSEGAAPSAPSPSAPPVPSPSDSTATDPATPPPAPSTSGPAVTTGPTASPASPEPSTPPSAPARVRAVSVSAPEVTGRTATASVTVTTDGTGPVNVLVTWYASRVEGEPGTQSGSYDYRREGATSYTFPVSHTYREPSECHRTVRAATEPAAANGSSTQQFSACVIT
ncbi:serine/threonine-protein kinase [Streptomyces sp. NPDC051018]|uniref:serine/threonine-protein kinase n=1 Tax=Streptomyces sp. NPDC051018 TaxID=3365639 RepID=UPI0037890DFA